MFIHNLNIVLVVLIDANIVAVWDSETERLLRSSGRSVIPVHMPESTVLVMVMMMGLPLAELDHG